jgi:hypothetical protein
MGGTGYARCERASGQKQVLAYSLPFAGDVRNSFFAKVFFREAFGRLPVKTPVGEPEPRIDELWRKMRRNAVESAIQAVPLTEAGFLPLALLSFRQGKLGI